MKANYRPSGMREGEKEMGGCIEEADRGRDVSAEICQDQKMSLLPYRYFHKQQRERSSLWKPKHHDLTVRKCADNPQTYTQSHVQTEECLINTHFSILNILMRC